MPPVFPPTKLDLHNAQVRASMVPPPVATPARVKVPQPGAMGWSWYDPHKNAANADERAATEAAFKLGGTTIFFGGSDNAAADAVKLLEGYHATINGIHHVVIDTVDTNLYLLRGVRSDPQTGDRREDQPYAIALPDIRSLAV